MNADDAADVLKALNDKVRGVDEIVMRRLNPLLLGNVTRPEVEHMLGEMIAAHDPQHDSGWSRPTASTFERRLRTMMRQKAADAAFGGGLETGDVVRCEQNAEIIGLVEVADEIPIVWVVSKTKVTKCEFWAVLSPTQHAAFTFVRCSSDLARKYLNAWLMNWRNELYDTVPPVELMRIALKRNLLETDLPAEPKQRMFPKPKAKKKQDATQLKDAI